MWGFWGLLSRFVFEAIWAGLQLQMQPLDALILKREPALRWQGFPRCVECCRQLETQLFRSLLLGEKLAWWRWRRCMVFVFLKLEIALCCCGVWLHRVASCFEWFQRTKNGKMFRSRYISGATSCCFFAIPLQSAVYLSCKHTNKHWKRVGKVRTPTMNNSVHSWTPFFAAKGWIQDWDPDCLCHCSVSKEWSNRLFTRSTDPSLLVPQTEDVQRNESGAAVLLL